jgi:hypothetical protein
MKVSNASLLWPWLLLSFGMLAHAQDVAKPGELSAEEIAKQAFSQAFVGLEQGTASIRMVISTAQGQKKDQTLSFKARRGGDGLLQYMVRFEKPADVKGTSFLVRERKGQLPDQYLYLPAAKVVRRIAAGNATSSFFGSDFIYADLLPYPAEKKDEVTLKRLTDTKMNGQLCYVLSIEPKSPESPYTKLMVYVKKKEMVPIQIDFYDKTKKQAKTLRIRKLKSVDSKLVPVELEMKNLLSSSKTELYVENVNPKAKLGENEFTEEAMQR